MVWAESSGVDVQHAVASSCCVPGLFPPVSIKGRSYVDGGMRTALNADVAVGHDAVVVISVMALAAPAGMSDPLLDRINAQVEAELAALQVGGAQVEVIEPNDEFLEISGWGLHLMDFGRAEAAYEAGMRQGADEAPRIQALWAGDDD